MKGSSWPTVAVVASTGFAAGALLLGALRGPGAASLAALPDVDLRALGLTDPPGEVAEGVADVVVISDYQCAYCATLHEDLAWLSARHEVRVRWVHLPQLGGVSRDAAAAAICADRQGRFDPMNNLLFALRDSLGRIPWEEFAIRARVGDAAEFMACIDDDAVHEEINAIAVRLRRSGVRITPTVVLNRHLLTGYPGREIVDHLLGEISQRREEEIR
ncbi:MAG: thioredoxin domain-containing protein [Longimicrobiales bacterium]|nr:thioredoxin domain-containing protein [Longimicrobiales bacterium]